MRISLTELNDQIQRDLLVYFNDLDTQLQEEVSDIINTNFKSFTKKHNIRESGIIFPETV